MGRVVLFQLKQRAGEYIFRITLPFERATLEQSTDPAGTSAFHPWVQEPRTSSEIQGFLNFGRSRMSVQRLLLADLSTMCISMDLSLGDPVFIRVFKQSSELEVWMQRHDGTWLLVRTWPICAWSGELGPKLREGDLQTPEGFYYITPGRMNPNSQWHLAMNIGYPNAYDREHGRTGSFIMIHGVCGSSGCLAMTNEGIEPIYTLVEAALNAGQNIVRVHIFPFRMSDEVLASASGSRWESFWLNLHQGYRFFEEHGAPPNVEVVDGRYEFNHAD